MLGCFRSSSLGLSLFDEYAATITIESLFRTLVDRSNCNESHTYTRRQVYFLKVIVVVEGAERLKDSLITQQHGTLAVLDTRLRLFESFKVNTGVCHRSAEISRSTGSGQRQLVAAVIVPVTEASGRCYVLCWLKEGRKKISFVII